MKIENGSDMKIVVIVFTRNAEKMLPFFIDHYKRFCDEIIVYDNMSTDRTCEIANKCMCKVHQYNSGKESVILYGIQLKNTVWKLYKGFDWTIIVDVDEFIYHESIKNYLENAKKLSKTLLIPTGYSMYSPIFPKYGISITEQIKIGIRNENCVKYFDKPCIFNSNLIKETNFRPGAHTINPKGIINIGKDKNLKLLHYKFIYEFEYLKNMYKILDSQRTNMDRKAGYGRFYTLDNLVSTLDIHKKMSKKVI